MDDILHESTAIKIHTHASTHTYISRSWTAQRKYTTNTITMKAPLHHSVLSCFLGIHIEFELFCALPYTRL